MNRLLSIVMLSGLFSAGALDTRQLTVSKVEDLAGGDGKTYTIELVGKPLPSPTAAVQFVTREPEGTDIAWAVVRSPEVYGLLGYDRLKNERHWIDLSKYHGEHGLSPVAVPGRGAVYILAGNRQPGIFKYDIARRETTLLRAIDPRTTGKYWLGGAVAPDGKIYFGIHPTATLLELDPAADRVTDLGRIADDPLQMYIILPAVDDRNILYAPVGLGKVELFAVDLANGARKQLLSPAQQAEYAALPGQQKVEIALKDGKVYRVFGGKYYLCSFDGVATEPTAGIDGKDDPRRLRYSAFANGDKPLFFNDDGLYVEEAGSGSRKLLAVAYPDGIGHELFAVGDVRDGTLYGSGIFGAKVFGLNLNTMVSTDYGIISTGTIQNYDLMDTPEGILLSSYTQGGLDLFDPGKPLRKGVNPRPLANLGNTHGQERLARLVRAGDAIYGGTMPIKAQLGGALVRIDPAADYRVTVWRNIMPEQSIGIVSPVPGEPSLLLLPGSIYGGSSSIPKLAEAEVALWDMAAQKIVWTGKHPGKFPTYNNAAPTSDGRILLFAEDGVNQHYLIFDPKTRSFVADGKLEGRRGFHATAGPVGPDASNYFVVGDILYKYNPRDGVVKLLKHGSFAATKRFNLRPDGMLYYLDNSRLMRVKLF